MSVGATVWIVVGAVALGAAVWFAIEPFRRASAPRRVRASAERVVAAHGPRRCQHALDLLRELAHAPQELPEAWNRIELPLVEALPDCPPDTKPELIRALDAAARGCAHRDTAKRLTTVRNSLVG
jgi:hypothetical protein